ncbi:MAG TPA: hypothetical protein VGR66_10725 [Candidatus Eisenbacteria bacterium]|jgi:hypothetical protein|nr:hypothetical protein [Candidatus Eisenbacteria bacterium]
MRKRDTRCASRVKIVSVAAVAGLLLLIATVGHAWAATAATVVQVELYEWKIELEPASVLPGPVRFEIVNKGAIPHGFEVEGHGVEKEVAQMAAGAKATLLASLPAGSFDTYCPVGNGSHKMLGMHAKLQVGAAGAGTGRKSAAAAAEHAESGEMQMSHEGMPSESSSPRTMKVTGGGAVIQILPGPFPFADSAEAVITQRPADQKADLEKKAHLGPYSNNVAPVTGTIAIEATDRGATGDAVDGTAEFTTQDESRWKLVMDRVQTRDIPFNPRFGGVIMGLYYHGASNVHTPLVPTIQSSLALWAYGRLYRNDVLVTDSAMVHVMLLSRTRREGDWALACWDCTHNPIEELQLQITPPPGRAPLEAPGGFLFLNWEKSTGKNIASEPGR